MGILCSIFCLVFSAPFRTVSVVVYFTLLFRFFSVQLINIMNTYHMSDMSYSSSEEDEEYRYREARKPTVKMH